MNLAAWIKDKVHIYQISQVYKDKKFIYFKIVIQCRKLFQLLINSLAKVHLLSVIESSRQVKDSFNSDSIQLFFIDDQVWD